jgi:DnaJ-domain-containing protein 1
VFCFAQKFLVCVLFCSDSPAKSANATGTNFPAGSCAMQIIHECRLRATILADLAKDDTELETQLLYVAQEWLTLATLREQLNTDAVGAEP